MIVMIQHENISKKKVLEKQSWHGGQTAEN